MSRFGEAVRPSTAVNTWMGTAAFIPSSVAGLTAWFDPSDVGSITASGGYVTQLNDLSGNGNHLTQTGTYGPITGTRTQNGLNVLDYYASSSRAALRKTNFTQAQPCTIFTVALSDNLTDDTNGQRALIGWTNTASYNGCAILQDDSNMKMYAATYPFTNAHAMSASTAYQWTGVFNGASSVLSRDGSVGATGDPGAQGWGGGSTLILGEIANNGAPGGFSYNVAWDGWIAETLIYDGVLSSTDRATVEAYLKTKWGTP